MDSWTPIRFRGRAVVPGAGPFIFGILNVTPDSFSDGGAYLKPDDAIAAGLRLADEGADVIDVGGESTRPGSVPVPAAEQIQRVERVIAGLAKRLGREGPALSIDTRSAEVATAALDAGASVINDVSALRNDPAMASVAAERGASVVLMHMKGTPADMQQKPVYDDVALEIKNFLAERVQFAVRAGIARERVIVDPGIGFGKTTAHNLDLIRRIDVLCSLGVPVLVGPSRKRFIGDVLDIKQPEGRLMGTVAAVAACVLAGVECVRVHDVAECRHVADLCAAIAAK